MRQIVETKKPPVLRGGDQVIRVTHDILVRYRRGK
jgi:hypothetical protein